MRATGLDSGFRRNDEVGVVHSDSGLRRANMEPDCQDSGLRRNDEVGVVHSDSGLCRNDEARFTMRMWVWCLLTVMMIALGGCGGETGARVRISQWIEPSKPFPEEIKTVAVVAAGDWLSEHPNSAGSRPVYADVAVIVGRAWADQERFDVSGPAADLVMKRMQAEIDQRDLAIRLVDRESFEAQMREREIAMSDLVNPDGVVKLPGMAPVDGLIVVRATATSNVERVPVDTITLNDISRAIQTDGNHVRTSQRLGVRRQITVNTSIRLTNAMTGVVQASYAAPKSQTDEARPGFLVGENMAEADLPAGAKVVQELLEDQVVEFVGAVVGTNKRGARVRVTASKNADCQAGVRLLECESWSAALDSFQRAITADAKDHRAWFGAGVAAEQMGQRDQALMYYERAVGLNDSAEYRDAVRRVRRSRAQQP